METESETEIIYQVVINDEEQYSIWPDFKALPGGWKAAGKKGPKEECLAFIGETWKDMRPASLRRRMSAEDDGGVYGS